MLQVFYPVIKCTLFFVHRREPDTQQCSDSVGNKDKQQLTEINTKNSYDAARIKLLFDFLYRNSSAFVRVRFKV